METWKVRFQTGRRKPAEESHYNERLYLSNKVDRKPYSLAKKEKRFTIGANGWRDSLPARLQKNKSQAPGMDKKKEGQAVDRTNVAVHRERDTE